MIVVDQCDQKMFEGRILVPATAGLPKRVVEGLFEFASKTRHLACYSVPAEKPAGFEGNVIRSNAAIKSRVRSFPQIIATRHVRRLNGRPDHDFLNRSSAADRWT